MPTERKNCISCRKNMGEKQEKNYLDYRNKEWQIARNHVCEDACNWCYWYAWDNHIRCESICEVFSMQMKEDQVE